MTSEGHEGRFIETYSGVRFYPFDPHPSTIRIADIAQGLSHTCRYSGQCQFYYSVAQHSLYVAHELEREGYDSRLQCFGLLHDAAEAYLSDLPRPIKAEFEEFSALEERILVAVWEAFDLDSPTPDEWEAVMDADDRLLHYEAGELLTDGSWADSIDLPYELASLSPAAVREQFLDRAEMLLGQQCS